MPIGSWDNDDILVKGDDGTTNGQKIASDGDRLATSAKIRGDDGQYQMDVVLKNGLKRAAVDAIVTVEEVFGHDRFADVWFYIGTASDCGGVGAAGDTVTVAIGEGCDAVLYPEVSVTTTVTAAMLLEPEPEKELAHQIVADLNADADFLMWFKASVIKDTSHVHISAKIRGELGERISFQTSTTGTTVTTDAYDSIIMRGKGTSLARDRNDPRVGILGVSGTVSVLPQPIGKRYYEVFQNGGSGDMRVNGSGTPLVFTIPILTDEIIFINQIRFFGGGNGIKFGQFLSKSGGDLTNGILVEIKSEDEVFQFEPILNTEDFKNLFSFPLANSFSVDVQAGSDQFIAIFNPDVPFALQPTGTYPVDDYIKITIRDNISSGLQEFRSLAEGFREEA
jgi:hypothetical protein